MSPLPPMRPARRAYRAVVEPLEERRLLDAALQASEAEIKTALLAMSQHPHALKTVPKPAVKVSVLAGPDANGVVTVSGQSYPRAKVKLDIGANGSAEQTGKATARGAFRFTFAVGYGATAVLVTATAAGRKPAAALLTVNRPDRISPTVTASLASPFSRAQATVTGRAADVGLGLASLSALVDGSAPVAVGVDGLGNFTYTTALPLNGTADGAHTVRLTAVDRAGNVGVWSSSFTLDTKAPAVSLQSPASGLTSQANFTVTGRVADVGSGVALVSAAVDGGVSVPLGVDASGNFTYTTALPLDGTADGAHVIRFLATDRAGNPSPAANFSFEFASQKILISPVGPLSVIPGKPLTVTLRTGAGI